MYDGTDYYWAFQAVWFGAAAQSRGARHPSFRDATYRSSLLTTVFAVVRLPWDSPQREYIMRLRSKPLEGEISNENLLCVLRQRMAALTDERKSGRLAAGFEVLLLPLLQVQQSTHACCSWRPISTHSAIS